MTAIQISQFEENSAKVRIREQEVLVYLLSIFVLVNILRLRQKDMIDLAMLKESEKEKNEYWEKNGNSTTDYHGL